MELTNNTKVMGFIKNGQTILYLVNKTSSEKNECIAVNKERALTLHLLSRAYLTDDYLENNFIKV